MIYPWCVLHLIMLDASACLNININRTFWFNGYEEAANILRWHWSLMQVSSLLIIYFVLFLGILEGCSNYGKTYIMEKPKCLVWCGLVWFSASFLAGSTCTFPALFFFNCWLVLLVLLLKAVFWISCWFYLLLFYCWHCVWCLHGSLKIFSL